jgi:hypothetical protein
MPFGARLSHGRSTFAFQSIFPPQLSCEPFASPIDQRSQDD